MFGFQQESCCPHKGIQYKAAIVHFKALNKGKLSTKSYLPQLVTYPTDCNYLCIGSHFWLLTFYSYPLQPPEVSQRPPQHSQKCEIIVQGGVHQNRELVDA